MTSFVDGCSYRFGGSETCGGELHPFRQYDGTSELRCENHLARCPFCDAFLLDARVDECELHDGWNSCEDCGIADHPDDEIVLYRNAVDRVLCQSCFDREWVLCSVCDASALRRYRGETVCDDCLSEGYDDDYSDPHANSSGRLFSHDYEPAWQEYGNDSTMFGIELEMEVGDDCNDCISDGIDIVKRHLGAFAICKYDGSLSHGMEVVTHPATIGYLRSSKIADMMDDLRGRGWRSWTTGRAGLHVHVSRTAFRDPVHLFVFTLFMYRNADRFAKYSGRTSDALDRWATFAEHTGRRYEYTDSLYDKVKRGCTGDKYSAVNFQHARSIEVRIFRGSLNPDTLFGAVELLNALVHYTSTVRASDFISGSVTWSTFVDFCRASGEASVFLRVADVRKVGA